VASGRVPDKGIVEVPRLPPARRRLPLIGESIAFATSPRDFCLVRAAQFGPIFRSHIFGRPTIVMVGPSALRFTLITHQKHFITHRGWPRGLRELMDGALMMKDEAEHQRTRRAVAPAFSRRALEAYLPTVHTTSKKYFGMWKRREAFDLYEESKLLMFDIAGQLLMGRNPGADISASASLFSDYVKGMAGIWPLLPLRLRWLPFGRAIRARELLLQDIAATIVRRRQSVGDDAVSLLLDAQEENRDILSDEALGRHILFLLFAGHESATSLLTTACLELAAQPHLLQRARAEVNTMMPDEADPSFETLERMTFLNQILLETERLHPPFSGAFRQVAEAFDFAGYHVPRGLQVFYGIVGTHHLEHVHTNAMRFDPDRFEVHQEKVARHDCTLSGFGGGAHSCIGKELARMEVKAMLARLIRDYELQVLTPPPIAMNPFPSLHPTDRIAVRLRRRIETSDRRRDA
jgi:cytochrome P450